MTAMLHSETMVSSCCNGAVIVSHGRGVKSDAGVVTDPALLVNQTKNGGMSRMSVRAQLPRGVCVVLRCTCAAATGPHRSAVRSQYCARHSVLHSDTGNIPAQSWCELDKEQEQEDGNWAGDCDGEPTGGGRGLFKVRQV